MAAPGLSLAVPGLGSLGLGLGGGMPGFSSSASSATGNGATIVGPSGGDWNVNLGGSGLAIQSASANVLLWAIVAVVVVWALRK